MANLLLWMLDLVLSVQLLATGIHVIKYLFSRRAAHKLTSGMYSGIFVEHGMVLDPKTGLVQGRRKPSRQAYNKS